MSVCVVASLQTGHTEELGICAGRSKDRPPYEETPLRTSGKNVAAPKMKSLLEVWTHLSADAARNHGLKCAEVAA